MPTMKGNNSKAKKVIMSEFGFLRETSEAAEKDGMDKEFNIKRTGLNEYLGVIFPNVTDWVHDKVIPGAVLDDKKVMTRPDYRSETLKLIVEFDGINHYIDPCACVRDAKNVETYKRLGYKVVRIPYFIQLTKSVVDKMFGVKVDCELFPEDVPSISISGKASPAYLCYRGLKRMAREFSEFPGQYDINIKYLMENDCNDDTDWKALKEMYDAYHSNG